LAAVSLGNSFLAMSLGIGFSTAITPLAAETDGTNNVVEEGRVYFIMDYFMHDFRFHFIFDILFLSL
jgi:MATE family multidrug resistance protein